MALDQLVAMAVFAKVVEAQSFTAAARDLGMSKSAVSKHVSRLEDHLGARLLNRTTRQLALTEIGSAFYERCSRLLAEAEEAELTVTRMSAEPRGELRVSMPFSFGRLHVMPLMCGFMRAHPHVGLDLTLDDRFVDLIGDGYDVAIRIGSLADSSLVARKLATSRHVVAAAPAYWQQRGIPQTPRDLAGHDCLVYSYLRAGPHWQIGGETIRVSGRVQANNGDVLMQAAVAGHGVVMLPTFIVWEHVRAGRLVPALEDHAAPVADIHAVFPHSRHLSPKVRAFVDHLVASFGERPYWEELTAGAPASS